MNYIRKTNFLVFCIGVIFALSSCQQKEKHDGYMLKGTVKGLNSGWVKLAESSGISDKTIVLDSAEIQNGVFEFKGKLESPDMFNLIINDISGRVFLENSEINIDIDWSAITPEDWQFTPEVSGSNVHKEYYDVEAKLNAVYNSEKYTPIEEYRKILEKARKSKDSKMMEDAMALQKKLWPLIEEQGREYTQIRHDFARENPDSPIAVHVLGYQFSEGRMSKEQLKEFYTLFKGDAKKTSFYRNFMTKVYKDVFENLGVGNTAPDFTLETVDCDELTLSEVQGKYRLVDFWASWCGPCRASFPHLKELRKKYGKDGFEIIGVGTADTEDKWRKAIQEDQTPWIHVFDVHTTKSYGPVAQSYAVPHLPTTFLIDSERKILLRNSTKEELDAKLKELFGR
ncbi:TlpA disulfide reductase family protein [Labilibaculum filiforme]|nr:TlpA disulfide reductase family protein [Labilibaculum filiforme]